MNSLAEKITANRERLLKIAISIFIIVHVSVTVAWLSPDTIALRHAITEATSGPWKFFGMWQGWELFAPKISKMNAHTIALITFEDGSTTQFPLPRFDQMDYFGKFQKDKFRKWNGDNAQWDRYKEYWPDLARYIGRLHNPKSSSTKPLSVTLVRFSGATPDTNDPRKRLDLQTRTNAKMIFFYRYKPEDFSL